MLSKHDVTSPGMLWSSLLPQRKMLMPFHSTGGLTPHLARTSPQGTSTGKGSQQQLKNAADDPWGGRSGKAAPSWPPPGSQPPAKRWRAERGTAKTQHSEAASHSRRTGFTLSYILKAHLSYVSDLTWPQSRRRTKVASRPRTG